MFSLHIYMSQGIEVISRDKALNCSTVALVKHGNVCQKKKKSHFSLYVLVGIFLNFH